MNGKGSKRRPSQITDKELQRRWELAFSKDKKPDHKKPKPDKPLP